MTLKPAEFPNRRPKKVFFALRPTLIGMTLMLAAQVVPYASGNPHACLSSLCGEARTSKRESLQEIFIQGETSLKEGRHFEAIAHFKTVLEADSNDWDARERLVGIYQALGLNEERDGHLGVLRRMHHSGREWKPYICRDQFLVGRKKIRALEIPGLEAGGARTILFMVSDPESGRVLETTAVRRLERPGPGKSVSGKADPGTYMVIVVSRARRKSSLVTNRKPDYSDMKREFLKSLRQN
jgi:hypothetical protein